MCLIPTQIMREIGLAQPLFIKFDDVDYGLRAEDHGYHTVCLPGVAVWHQAWHAKDPSRTWEGYYLYRNHWICSLLHCTKPSWHFLYGMLFDDAKAGVELVYSAMHLHHLALRDIMRGPDYIADTLATKLGDVRKAREGFPDSATTRNRDDFPHPEGRIHRKHETAAKHDRRAAAGHEDDCEGICFTWKRHARHPAGPADSLARRVLARLRGRELRGRDLSGR